MNPEEDWNEYDEEEDEGCDYDLSEFCEHPDLRDLGCCFECPIYLEALEEKRSLPFMGEVMKCAKCGREQRSDPRVESNWWCIACDGMRFYFCPDCFHPEDPENAYQIMKYVIETVKKVRGI